MINETPLILHPPMENAERERGCEKWENIGGFSHQLSHNGPKTSVRERQRQKEQEHII